METIRFEDLELDAKIMRAITDMGFEAASPIQGQAIPLELQGLDIIGQAQTGTGKTAAFGIPLLQKIDPKNKKPQAIILCPTRELAIQVSEEIRRDHLLLPPVLFAAAPSLYSCLFLFSQASRILLSACLMISSVTSD